MVTVKKEGVVLKKTALGFECDGVLNPAVIQDENGIHMFYRAVGKGNYSSIGYCKLSTPCTVSERAETPVIFPQFDYESHGVEDPRIVKIDGLYYLTYTAYDGINAFGALAVSKDLKQFEKLGIITPLFGYEEFQRLAGSKAPLNEKYIRYNKVPAPVENQAKTFVWDKNVIFFPRRVNGKLYFLHRIKPDILIVGFNDLSELTAEFWQNYFLHFDEAVLLSPKFDFGVSYIGGGCPPIETPQGWVVIYHGVHDTLEGYVYSACAALLDLENPQKEISRLPYALFRPELHWELKGEVNNVCFPTGAIVQDGTLFIYYGAADEQIAVASLNFSELVKELMLYSDKNDE